MKTAIAVIGHENWGKSATLKQFAGSAHKHWIETNGKWFYVKHMSNDDIFGELYDWVKNFINKYKNNDYGLIFALCPDFENAKKKTKSILKLLKDFVIEIKFFVLNKNYNNKKPIQDLEIKELKRYGKVYITDGTAESNVRAKELNHFVKSNIK